MGPLRDATQLMEMDLSKPISRGTGHDLGHRHLGHDLAWPRGETSWALRGPNPVKLVEMLRAKGPKSGIMATTKRYGPLGPYGAILRRKNLSHHGVGLVAAQVKVLKILAATDTMTMLAMMVMDTMTMITTAMTMDMAIMAMMVLGMNLVATIAMLVKM